MMQNFSPKIFQLNSVKSQSELAVNHRRSFAFFFVWWTDCRAKRRTWRTRIRRSVEWTRSSAKWTRTTTTSWRWTSSAKAAKPTRESFRPYPWVTARRSNARSWNTSQQLTRYVQSPAKFTEKIGKLSGRRFHTWIRLTSNSSGQIEEERCQVIYSWFSSTFPPPVYLIANHQS